MTTGVRMLSRHCVNTQTLNDIQCTPANPMIDQSVVWNSLSESSQGGNFISSISQSRNSRLSAVGFTSSRPWFWAIKMASPLEQAKQAAGCKWCRHKEWNRGRVMKHCWLATRRSGVCQLPLQLSPYLEGAAKSFCFMNRVVLSRVMRFLLCGWLFWHVQERLAMDPRWAWSWTCFWVQP